MRKFYYLFLTLMVISSAINAQFITLENSGVINGMSPDGQYVIGANRFYKISDPAAAPEWVAGSSYATAVSNSGRIVGTNPGADYEMVYYDPEDGSELWRENLRTAAYRQYGEETWITLPLFLADDLTADLANTHYGGDYPYAISDDGSIIAGGFLPGTAAIRKIAGYWEVTADGVDQVIIENDIYGPGSLVYGMSGDGKVMGGYYAGTLHSSSRLAVLWKEGTRVEIPEIKADTYISAVSHNGRYAVMNDDNANSIEYDVISPVRAAICNIDELTYTYLDRNQNNQSAACAVSDNGIVVGYRISGREKEAFLYTPSRGMIGIDVLLDELDIDYPEGFIFQEAKTISADGTIIAGYGTLNGVQTGFYVVIGDKIPAGVYGVEEVQVEAWEYGTVTVTWSAPQENLENTTPLIGYDIYRDGEVIESVDANTLSYKDNVEDGTYTYYIQALYDTDKYEAQESAHKTITMGTLTPPYFDTFDDYTIGDAASLRKVRYWDVSTNYVTLENSWQPQLSGNPPFCVEFKVPSGGVYDETLTTAFINAKDLTSVQFNFVIAISAVGAKSNLSIEVYDGEEWSVVEGLRSDGNFTGMGAFIPYRYDLTDKLAGKENVRVRFRAYGTSDGNTNQWIIDNLEITDSEHALPHPEALAIQVTYNEENNVNYISWIGPEETAKLRYMDADIWTGNIIGNFGVPFIAASMFPAEEMEMYDGYYVTELAFMPSQYIEFDEDGNQKPRIPAQYRCFISQGGERLCSEDISNIDHSGINLDEPTSLEWYPYTLEKPVPIDGSKPFYYGVEVVYHDEGDLPIATSDVMWTEYQDVGEMGWLAYHSVRAADGRGNLVSEDGGTTWEVLEPLYSSDGSTVYTLINVSTTLSKDPEFESSLPHFSNSYLVTRNGVNLIHERFGEESYHTGKTFIVDYEPMDSKTCYEVLVNYHTKVYSEPISQCITPTDIESYEKDKDGISVYPSPLVKGQSLTVDLGVDKTEFAGNIRIYNSTGTILKDIPVTERITTVNINFPAGIYFVHINDKVVKIAVE